MEIKLGNIVSKVGGKKSMINLSRIDKNTVDGLTELYEKDLNEILVSVRTGATTSLPKTVTARAQLLNMLIYQPEFILVFGGQIAFSHLDVYRSYLKRTNRRFAIIVGGLKGKTVSQLKLDDVPVYIHDDDFNPIAYLTTISSLNALLYVSHKPYNFRVISRSKTLIHTYSGHGQSDKHTADFSLASAFDYILRTDTASTHRFYDADLSLSPSRFLLTGGAPVEGVKFPKRTSKFKKILYTPTWEGHDLDVDFSSIADISDQIIERAAVENTIAYRSHPAIGNRDPSIKDLSNTIKAVAKTFLSKAKAFNWSDAILTDISGVLPEYLFTGKPIIIPVSRKSWKFKYLDKTDLPKYCYIWVMEDATLPRFLKSIAKDPLKEARLKRRSERFLGSSTIDELCLHFERALDFMEQARYQRGLKILSQAPNTDKGLFAVPPEDHPLAKTVADIRSGKKILGLN